jgi:hypothetical protein
MRVPKLNLAAGNDKLRPALQYIYVNKEHITATNGHILILHNRSLLDFIVDLPSECFILNTEWVKLTKSFKTAIYDSKLEAIILENKRWSKTLVKVKTEVKFKYPNFLSVMKENLKPVEIIRLDPKLLLDLSQAASIEKTTKVELQFSGINKGINVYFLTIHNRIPNVKGLIMPILTNNL